MNSLVLNNISIKAPGANSALITDLSMTVSPGEIVTIMGKSGIGKSTLLSFIGGHLDRGFKTSGTVSIGTKDITHMPAEKRKIGILFQDDLLFPHLTVGDNLAFGLTPDIKGRKERKNHITQALKITGLDGFADCDPATLSGGQRARIALMRTLLARPSVLLLDEPFSKLDGSLRDDIRSFVFTHGKGQQLPILMVTHDTNDAVAAGGRRILL